MHQRKKEDIYRDHLIFLSGFLIGIVITIMLIRIPVAEAATFKDYTTQAGDYYMLETGGLGTLIVDCKRLEIGNISDFSWAAVKHTSGTTTMEVWANGREATTYYKSGTSQGSSAASVSGEADHIYKASWSTPIYCNGGIATIELTCSNSSCNPIRLYTHHSGVQLGTQSDIPYFHFDNSYSASPSNVGYGNSLALKLEGTAATTSESGGGSSTDISPITDAIYYLIALLLTCFSLWFTLKTTKFAFQMLYTPQSKRNE